MAATVHRNMPDRVIPAGEVPGWHEGRWFTHCEDCGHFLRGRSAWFDSPEAAQRAADRHNRDHHESKED